MELYAPRMCSTVICVRSPSDADSQIGGGDERHERALEHHRLHALDASVPQMSTAGLAVAGPLPSFDAQ